MSSPGFQTPSRYPAPPPRSRGTLGWVFAGLATAIGLSVLLSQCKNDPPPTATTVPPEPRILEPWEVKTNAIVIVFNDSGRFYGAAQQNYFQADREASDNCNRQRHQNTVCYGIRAYEAEATGKVCVGIGVDFFEPVPRSQRLTTAPRDITDYVIERAPKAQEALDKVWAACRARPGNCDFGVFVQCNFPSPSPNGQRFSR